MLRVMQYKPGEMVQWLRFEKTVFEQLNHRYSRHGNWQRAISEVEKDLKTTKKEFDTEDEEKYSYHAESAGRRFLEGLGQRIERPGIIRVS